MGRLRFVPRLSCFLVKAVGRKCQVTAAVISGPRGSQGRQRRRGRIFSGLGKKVEFGWAWCSTPVVLVLGRQTGRWVF